MKLTRDETKSLLEKLGELYDSGQYSTSIYPILEDHHITQKSFAESKGKTKTTAGLFLARLVDEGILVQERRHNRETGRWVYVYVEPSSP